MNKVLGWILNLPPNDVPSGRSLDFSGAAYR